MGPVRPDGFHEIASLMVPVSLADRVIVEKTPGAGLDVVCDVAPGADNLAARLVRELEQRLDRSFEVRVTIEKRVPHGGGLGGGSSDAAATLLALERLFGLELSPRLRYEAAAAVGSDVPFFLWPGAQLAMGRGQVLKQVHLPALRLVIAMPDVGLSTAAVYGWRDEDAEVGAQGVRAQGEAALEQAPGRQDRQATWRRSSPTTSSRASCRRREAVGELIERLRSAGALAAAMTGSGAAVFGLFATEARALKAREAVAPARSWYVTDLQPEAPRRARPPGRQTPCVIDYSAASRRAAGRLAAPRPSGAGA